MHLSIKKGDPLKQKTPCLVLGVIEGKLKEPLLQQLDKQLAGHFARAVRSKEFSGRKGENLLLHVGPGLAAERVLLFGLGKEKSLSLAGLRQAASGSSRLLAEKQLGSFLLALPQVPLKKDSLAERVQAIAEGVLLADYRYDRYLSKDKPGQPVALDRVALLIGAKESTNEADTAVAAAQAICNGVCFARDLVNDPGNLKSPQYLSMAAVAMAEKVGISAQLLRREQLEKQGFGALLGVAQGSEREPYLIVLEYRGGTAEQKPIALVGKGVVFDAGGISLKPAEKMDEMKMDMAGAAAVLGTMQAAAGLKLPVNLVAVVPTVENLPSGTAIRPGDILTSLSGKTIEVLNTDAEGRLVLADCIWYAQDKYNPKVMVDLATLTGAIIITLGRGQYAGMFTPNDDVAAALDKAGNATGDKVWRLPLTDEYDHQLDCDIADMKNIGGKDAGSITAAQFLKRFTNNKPWVHLDVAGMVFTLKAGRVWEKGATGYGVRLLNRYVKDNFEGK